MPYIVCNVFENRYVSHLSHCGIRIIARNPQDAKRFDTEEEAERYAGDNLDVFEVKE